MTETKRTEENLDLDRCAFCGEPSVSTIHKDKLFGKGSNAIIIENLPIRHCESCGESYYEPGVSKLIDEILAHPEQHTIVRPVSIATLAA
jgi:YgiT-type zinc finger domain-containing protein